MKNEFWFIGSGRKKKPLLFVVEELQEEIMVLSYDVYALHKKLDRVKARWNYWLAKIEKEGWE